MKKKTRRIIACLLAVLLMAGLLGACGAQPAPTEKTPQSTAGNTEKQPVGTTAEAIQTQPATTAENVTEATTEAVPPTTEKEPETTTAEPVSAWPEKEVSLVCNGSIGGSSDTLARVLANVFDGAWKSSPKVINMSGDSWNAFGEVLIAGNDGYLLGFAPFPGLISSYVKAGASQTYRDFTNIAGIVKNPYVIFTLTESPYQSLQDLVAKGKESETAVAVLNGGDVGDMLVQKLNKRCGAQFKAYGYATRPDMLTAMSSGAAGIAPAATLYQRGDFRVLAVLDASPSFVFPDAPLIDQAGVAELQGFYFRAGYGLIAPAGLEQEAADRIQQALAKAETDSDFVTLAHNFGYDVELMNGDEYDTYLQAVEDDFREYYGGTK